MRSLTFVFLILGLVVPACDGTGPAPLNLDNPGPTGGGIIHGTPPGSGTPAPAPDQGPAVVFDDATLDLGKSGAFPSDLVRDGAGTVYTVDDAQIPARVLGFRDGARVLDVPLTAADLVDQDGTTPARTPGTFSASVFGAFTGDLELAFGRWLFVGAGGGNSMSADAQGAALRLANLVVIDTQTAKVVQTVNLAWPLAAPGQFSNGGPYVSIPQSLPSMISFVPDPNGTPTGTVFVAMSNGAGSLAGLTVFLRGTVQAWQADFTQGTPLGIVTTGKAPKDVTRTFLSNHFNPAGLTRYTSADGRNVLILTNAGSSKFGTDFIVRPTSDAVLEFLDLDTWQWRDGWTSNLGPILPAVQALALGRDADGESFGVLTSQTFAAAYVVDLGGLESNPVDPTRLGLLHTVDLAPGGSVTAGSGFQPGVAVTPSGGTAVVTGFETSSLHVLELPGSIRFGAVEVDPAPFAGHLGPGHGLGLGAIVVNQAGATFIVNGGFDNMFVPNRDAFLGTLTARDGLK